MNIMLKVGGTHWPYLLDDKIPDWLQDGSGQWELLLGKSPLDWIRGAGTNRIATTPCVSLLYLVRIMDEMPWTDANIIKVQGRR